MLYTLVAKFLYPRRQINTLLNLHILLLLASLLTNISRMGISRSATVVAAYLTFRHGFTPAQSLAWLKFQRPIVHPNSGFQEQLHDYYSVLQMDHPGRGQTGQGQPGQGGHLGDHEDNQPLPVDSRQLESSERNEIPGFGWSGLTMCSEIVIDEERERRKR